MVSRKIALYPWQGVSEGAKHLANAMGVPRLKQDGSKYKGRPEKTVINWGRSSFQNNVGSSRVINPPEAVARVSNKLTFFRFLEDKKVAIVPCTTSLDKAISWLKESKDFVVARTKLTGSGGEGIVMMNKDDPATIVQAPLYTRYIPKQDEFRVHIMGGEVFLVQRKGLRKTDDRGNPINPENVDWKIRNLANGFVFVRNNIDIPKVVTEAALSLYPHLGLDFYAADVILNQKSSSAYVLEVNTAPGLSGETVNDYARAFDKYLSA